MPMAATRGQQTHSGLEGGHWRRSRERWQGRQRGRMLALVGGLEVNPALVLWPAELWALAAGVPWDTSHWARATGAGGPGPDRGDSLGTWGPIWL